MAGTAAERQESGVVKAINDAFRKNKSNPFTVSAGNTKINNVVGAKKFSGRQATGSEPYTDVILQLKNKKDVNLSLKGEAAPSLAGGGLRGLELIVPGIANRFMKAAYDKLIEMGLKAGDKVPTTEITAAFESTVCSCRVTVAEVTVPQIFDTTTLYFVPEAGSTVLVLVIVKLAVVTPE